MRSLVVLLTIFAVSGGYLLLRETVAISATAAGDPELVWASDVLEVLRSAPDHGLNTTAYDAAGLETSIEQLKHAGPATPDRAGQLTELAQRAMRDLLTFAHDVAFGRVSPESLSHNWKPRREMLPLDQSVRTVPRGGLAAWILSLQPRHAEYAALQHALTDLRSQELQGGWPELPPQVMKPGATGPSVVLLRQRLTLGGELSANPSSNPSSYDRDVEAAVRAFQERHAIKPSGIADRATITAMNVPVSARIQQVELNLERWRWMLDDFGPRHVMVNIPAFAVMVREDGRTVRTFRAIVGKPGNETPIFSGAMETVVFSPYWNVPDSIAQGETAPAAARDPNYLARNHMEVLRQTASGPVAVDPDRVDWSDPSALRNLSFRQKPGAKNALGHVKFLFPNPFNVYLHDTPTGRLFERAERAFSHGCIRVDEPKALAAYVLRDDPEWTGDRISAAMNAGVERHVKLDDDLPVHVVYFTTWVVDNGLYFLPDVYGYDARQLKLAR